MPGGRQRTAPRTDIVTLGAAAQSRLAVEVSSQVPRLLPRWFQ